MDIDKKLNLLADEYEFDILKVKKYYNILQQYQFVKDGNEENLFICLEMIISEIVTQKLIMNLNASSDKQRNLSEIISEMVYRVYGDVSINQLDDNFVKQRKLVLRYIPFDEDLSPEEKQYNGYE